MSELDAMDKERTDAIVAAGAQTEEQMRAAKVPTPHSIEDLSAFVESLVDRPHDYGTCVYAMSHAAVAAFNYVAHRLGVTGFQASCADMDILRHTRGWKAGRIIDYENLLYPQYRDSIPGFDQYVAENREWLADEARKKLAALESDALMSGTVVSWWKKLAAASPAAGPPEEKEEGE